MPPAPLPKNEEERLRDARSLDVLDSAGEHLLDSFTRIARSLFGTPISAISLIDADKQRVKSAVGLDARELPRPHSPCAHTILAPDRVLVVPDMATDPRFSDNPLVTGEPHLRFYAGAPILSDRGNAVGAICVVDHAPRELPPGMEERLRDLARGVSAALTLRQATQELRAMALRDPLTGAGNRKALEATLQVGGPGLGLLMLDLDRFKTINDVFGHAGGDRALVEVARRLRRVARTSDEVIRLGGDEFAIILRNLRSPEAGLLTAARVHDAFADTFVVNGTVLPLRTSIGFAACPWHAADPSALLERADAALYAAKRAGRGTTRIAAADSRGVPGRSKLEMHLRDAFASGGPLPFRLVFQPIVRLADGSISSAEALLRWATDTPDAPLPSEFVPLIESLGQAVSLDRWVLEQVCRLLAASERPPCRIALNMSAPSFSTPGLDGHVVTVLRQHGVEPGWIALEMTETTLAHDRAQVLANVEGLRANGIAVALDDFGGGHGTLARMRRYPFSEIKLDRSLIVGCDIDSRSAILLDAVSNMAVALGIPAVAEGVETAAELTVLQRLGVARVQGFLLSRPVSWAELPLAGLNAGAKARDILLAADLTVPG